MSDQVCLISAPIATEYRGFEETSSQDVRRNAEEPPLGILSLASILALAGPEPQIVNLDTLYLDFIDHPRERTSEEFVLHAANFILRRDCAIYGFGSISSSYPLTLRLASEVKRARPSAVVLLGGPQATVVAQATLNTFPFVDAVLRGEADATLPGFLDALDGKIAMSSVPGLTYRAGLRVQQNSNAPPVEDLDCLPLPAYHLNGGVKPGNRASLEIGRGCPFACRFCSTNDFFRRRFRLKSPDRTISQMREINRQYGATSFDLVHDMFTVDRRRVSEFCEAMQAAGEGFTWSCSARTDCVDESLLKLMARAGCIGVFFGIETGSPRMQKIIDKGLDIPEARRAITVAENTGIRTTAAFIAGFPEETTDDLEQTAWMFVDCLKHPNSQPQATILAPLAETPITTRHRDELVLEELCSTVSNQAWSQDPVDRLMIAAHPDLFPNFYLIPTPHLDRAYVLELLEFLRMCSARFRWLLLALCRYHGRALRLFDLWREYRLNAQPSLAGYPLRRYYCGQELERDFLAFVETRPECRSDPAVSAFWEAEVELASSICKRPAEHPMPSDGPDGGPLRWDMTPRLAADVHLLHLDWDLEAVRLAMVAEEPRPEAHRETWHVTHPLDGHKLSFSALSNLAGEVLQRCDGNAPISQIAVGFEEVHETVSGVPGKFACVLMIEELLQQGLLRISGAMAA